MNHRRENPGIGNATYVAEVKDIKTTITIGIVRNMKNKVTKPNNAYRPLDCRGLLMSAIPAGE